MKKFLDLFRVSSGKNYALTFALVCSLFLLWGFCNGMIDVLNKHFQQSLKISKTESAFVQFANYMGYFFMALPSGLLARKFGYKGGILVGLALIALGAFWFVPATKIGTYSGFLAGLFILAAGLAVLETIANPYTTVLGPPEKGPTRINMAQTFNAVGWILGPLVGGQFVLSSTSVANTSNATLYIPYLGVAVVVSILVILFAFSDLPDLAADSDIRTNKSITAATKPLASQWHFTLAVAAQFLYVAAQTGIFSYFVNYVTSPDMPNLPRGLTSILPASMSVLQDAHWRVSDLGASRLLSFGGFALFLLGRFSGSILLGFFRAHTMLAVFALADFLMMLLIVLPLQWVSVAALFLSFFFMSIMYPTIFALGIRGLGDATKLGSSLIVMAIAGGAVMPLLMGWLADSFSMRVGFIMPLLCFAFIAFYALLWPRLETADVGLPLAD